MVARNYQIDWPYEPGDLVECYHPATSRAFNRYLIVKQAGVTYSATHNWYAYSCLVLMTDGNDKIHPHYETKDFHGMSYQFLLTYQFSNIHLHERATRIHNSLHIFSKAL
jgi:hypothetical protein